MPRLSGKFDEVYFGTFLSNCGYLFSTLTPNCDLDLEFGNINIMCDIFSNYGLLFLLSLTNFPSASFEKSQRN